MRGRRRTGRCRCGAASGGLLLLLGAAIAAEADTGKEPFRAPAVSWTRVLEKDFAPPLGAAIALARASGQEVDEAGLRARFETLVRAAREAVPADGSLETRAEGLNAWFFGAGGFRSIRRTDPNHFYIHRVLETGTGYCLGLAVIYLALARAVGLEATGVALPGHLFVRLRQGEAKRNVELLDEGRAYSDAYYRHQYDLHPDAVAQGVYLRDLDAAALLANLLNNEALHRLRRRRPAQALDLAERALDFQPLFPGAHLHRGLAFLLEGKERMAETAFRAALAIDPGYRPAWAYLERMRPAPARGGEAVRTADGTANECAGRKTSASR